MPKRIALAFTAFAVLLLTFFAASPATAQPLPSSTALVCPAQSKTDTFVTQSGPNLIQDGKVLTLRGFTFYPADDGGPIAWSKPQFSDYLDTHVFPVAQALGQNLLRPTDEFSSATKLTWDNPTVWANLDHLVCGAVARHEYVLLDLSFISKVLEAEGKDVLNPVNWYPALDFAAKRYVNIKDIAAVTFLGEPQYPTTQAQLDTLTTFYRDLLNRWWLRDQHHVLMLGGLTHLTYGIANWWESLELLPHVGIVGFKTYSIRDEQYQPTVDAFAKAHNLAEADEEFGLQQQMGDATWSGVTYNGLQVSRADFYKWVYAHASSGHWSMAIFWNSAGGSGPTTYDVNSSTPAVEAVIKTNAPNK